MLLLKQQNTIPDLELTIIVYYPVVFSSTRFTSTGYHKPQTGKCVYEESKQKTKLSQANTQHAAHKLNEKYVLNMALSKYNLLSFYIIL